MAIIVAEMLDALKSIGVPDDLARKAASATTEHLVTKADLAVAMSQLESRLIRWMVGTMFAMTAIFGGIVAAARLIPTGP